MATPDTTPHPYPSDLTVGVTSSRLEHVSPAARVVHQWILRAFATVGHAPDDDTLARGAADGHHLKRLLKELHDNDIIRLDDNGRIKAAYPFSARPTAHIVAVNGGPTVYAMCAIDALGIAAMVNRDVTIISTDPTTRRPVTVTIHSEQTGWAPSTAVAFVGSDTTISDADCCTTDGVIAAADRCCGVMNLFENTTCAQQWMTAHPDVSGQILTQDQALRLGVDLFGSLLDDQLSDYDPWDRPLPRV